MSSTFSNIFERMSYVVDKYYDEKGSKLCNEAGINRQNFTNWRNAYKEGKEPNIEFKILQPVVDEIAATTDINIAWLLTGNGDPHVTNRTHSVIDQSADHKKKVRQVSNSELDKNEKIQWLVENRKEVLAFLRSLEQ